MLSFEKVLEKALQLNPRINKERVVQAHEYAKKMHAGEYRMSGDPYIVHLLAVADILLLLTPDEDTLIAALLHSVTGRPKFDDKVFKDMFGDNVHFLVHGVESLDRVRSRDYTTDAEVIRRMFFTIAKDLRVILIKMADRLHNMETLSYRSETKQKLIAKETLDIYVPISARLGIYHLKGKLEDKAFKYLQPSQYQLLKKELKEYCSQRGETIDDICKRLTEFLKRHNIDAVVDGRIKNLYSIYRKLKAKSHSTLQDIYDVYALRVTLPIKSDHYGHELNDQLYAVLGLIHGNSEWKPLPHRFKDYVAVPKYNGYQSLHTAVLGLSSSSTQPTEIQIRSQRMHDEAEYGVASHWIYKDVKTVKESSLPNRFSVAHMAAQDSSSRNYVQWIASLAKIQKDFGSGEDFFDALKTDYFTDRIFVMTPNGEVKDLPQGSTPVDFAYSIHSDVGHCCQLAKVNGKVVSLDYELQNGEMVEIVTAKSPQPKSLWLSFVKTPGAKAKIRAYFRSSDKERIFREGKELLNQHLSRMGKPLLDEDLSIFRYYNGRRLPVKDRVGLVEEVGNGSVLPTPVLRKAFGGRPHEERMAYRNEKIRALKFRIPKKKRSASSSHSAVFIDGMDGLPHRFANCCMPKVGQPIVGYITRNHAVTIHLERCRHLRKAREERILDAKWAGHIHDKRYSVKLEFELKDRVGLIRDIADVISSMNINILSFSQKENDRAKIFREAVVEVSSNDELVRLVQQLERVRNVMKIRRTDGSAP